MPKIDDLSCCLTALDQDSTLIAVIEMGLTNWLVGALVPGVARQPLKKLEPDAGLLLKLLIRWCEEAKRSGRPVSRVCVAYEAGRDGFWLARWLRAQGIEAHVIHPTSTPVKRDHRRAKTDRLDIGLLKRSFLGWLRGEAGHCSMAAVPTLAEEDAKRPGREREVLVGERTRLINRIKSTLIRFGIRHFKPTLRKAAEKLEQLRTPEDVTLPPNTMQELRHDLERLQLVKAQIKMIETARLERIDSFSAAVSEAVASTIFPSFRVRRMFSNVLPW